MFLLEGEQILVLQIIVDNINHLLEEHFMKKLFKSICITFILTLATGPAIASDEVKLMNAHMSYSSPRAPSRSFRGAVEVKNISYHKEVYVVYSGDDGQTWTWLAASYSGPTIGGYESWTFSTGGHYGFEDENVIFYLQYNVAGQTYYNNQDYVIGTDNNPATEVDNSVLGVWWNISKQTSITSTNQIPYQNPTEWQISSYTGPLKVYVRNQDTEANVYVRFTTDGWNTWSNQLLTRTTFRMAEVDGYEYWDLQINGIPLNTDNVEYALYIEYSDGQQSWDNNLGRNYSVQVGN